MNRKSIRILFGCILLLGAGFMTATSDHGSTLPFILFPIGMIISAIGSFFHGPADPIPANGKDFSIRDKTGVVLLLIGVVFMISAALLKFFGFGVTM
jgi:hypothetical protein